MKPETYFLETFGCQMNVLDSQLVDGQLRGLGLRRVESSATADVILFNTCSVRQHAENKVLSRLGRLKAVKRRRPQTIIGVIGCMAERQKEGLFAQAPHIDLLCGPGELHRLPELLDEVRERHARVAALAGSQSRRTEVLKRAQEYDSLESLDLSRRPDTDESVLQSYVRVQRGCDKFCTYCVVPFVRGPERSRPPDHIVAEAQALADRGCREITLLGQTVNSYAYAEDGQPVRFARLLERVDAIAGLDRIRFVTSFPADWDEDIFRVMRDHPRICPYLHIPAQSGSDRILKAMKRGYTVDEYLRLMDTARKYVPGIALAGDFIVGFCGETEEEFQATVALVRRVEYKSIFVFKYSPRPGTSADRAQVDDVPIEIKDLRNNELLAVQSAISLKQKQALIGRTVEVLVEGYSKTARKVQAADDAATLLPRREGDSSIPLPPREGSGEGPSIAPSLIGSGEAQGAHESPSLLGRGQGEGLRAHGQAIPLPPREGLGEGPSPTRQFVGRTPHDLIAVFDGSAVHIGALVNVRIESVSPLTLFGHIESVASPPRATATAAGLSLPTLPPTT